MMNHVIFFCKKRLLITAGVAMLSGMLLLSGCRRNVPVLRDISGTGTESGFDSQTDQPVQARRQSTSEADHSVQNGQSDAESMQVEAQKNTPPSGYVTETTEENPETEQLLYVYVCGAVKNPGVYSFRGDARVYEAVEAAGGFLDTADPESVNQAGRLYDGQMLKICTMDETAAGCVNADLLTGPDFTDGEGSPSSAEEGLREGPASQESKSLINLNTASEEQLMTLPGIGHARARLILDYRMEHGSFERKEDIMKISGIKTALYEQIKDCICTG